MQNFEQIVTIWNNPRQQIGHLSANVQYNIHLIHLIILKQVTNFHIIAGDLLLIL